MSEFVRDLMEKDVVTISPEVSLPDVERIFAGARFGAVPVLDRDHRLKGIVSRTDIVRKFSLEQTLAELADSDFDQVLGVEDDDDALSSIGAAVGARLSKVKAGDIMITKVISTTPDATLKEAANLMVEHRFHRLPVVDDGRLVGIISAFDLMEHYSSNASARSGG